MPQAVWNNQIIAQSTQCEVVEGNIYFPPDALDMRFFKPSPQHTVWGWKGRASYYDIDVGGVVNAGGAWYYPEPLAAAAAITGYVAFWRGVQVTP